MNYSWKKKRKNEVRFEKTIFTRGIKLNFLHSEIVIRNIHLLQYGNCKSNNYYFCTTSYLHIFKTKKQE